MKTDFFRPHWEPAQSIYDAFQAEAEKRPERSFEEWSEAEIQVVHEVACKAADAAGVEHPTLEQIRKAESSAFGHVDYGLKWATSVATLVQPSLASGRRRPRIPDGAFPSVARFKIGPG